MIIKTLRIKKLCVHQTCNLKKIKILLSEVNHQMIFKTEDTCRIKEIEITIEWTAIIKIMI